MTLTLGHAFAAGAALGLVLVPLVRLVADVIRHRSDSWVSIGTERRQMLVRDGEL